MFTDITPRGIWKHKFNQCTDGEARLKSFPGATSKELAHCCTHLKRGIFSYCANARWDQ